jgi:predicted nucleic acid-binding protein
MYLLDTNVLSELIRKRPDPGVVARAELLDQRDCFASEVTLFELRYGAMLRDDAKAFWQLLCEQVLPSVTWLPSDAAVHLRAADLAAGLERSGKGIGNEDCWIAATALEHGLTLSSRNVSHFRRIPGLRVENWFST